MNIYRVLLIPNHLKAISSGDTNNHVTSSGGRRPSMLLKDADRDFEDDSAGYKPHQSAFQSLNEGLELSSMSSTGSGSSNNSHATYNKMLQDFKQAISKRKTPRHLKLMSQFLILSFLVSIILTGIDFDFKMKFITESNDITDKQALNEAREVVLIEITQNIRSFINIANHLEFETYYGEGLQRIDRFGYLRQLIQTKSENLQATSN